MAAPASPSPARIARLLGLAGAVLLGTVAASGWTWWQFQRAVQDADHAHRVLYELESTLVHAVSVQSGVRGFSLTGDERYLAPFEAGMVGLQHSTVRLRDLTAGSQPQRSRLTRLQSLVNEEVAVMQQRLSARRTGGLQAASAAVTDGRGKQVVEAIRGVIAAMQKEERAANEQHLRVARRLALGGFAILLVGGGVSAGLMFVAARHARQLGVQASHSI